MAISLRKKLAFFLVVCGCTYSFAELVASAIGFADFSQGTDSFWMFEESGRTIHFDPIRGYKLTTTPSRFARVTRGQLEYVGSLKGNRQGYPDEDDFAVEQPTHVTSRYVVFGDSFTSAQFLQESWPEHVETLSDDRWQLLNFSIDGGGLANWWSSFVHVLDKQAYDFDGVIFAVFGDDLQRGFTVAEHRGYDRHMFGRVRSWDTTRFPRTADDATRIMRPMHGYILTSDAFDLALRNRYLQGHRSQPLYRYLWITYNSYKLARSLVTGGREARARHPGFSTGQLSLIGDLHARLQSRGVRPVVVHVPSRSELLDQTASSEAKKEAEEFARLLDARFLDGGAAFLGLTPDEIRECWLQFDGHWGQRGSDRFGEFILRTLSARATTVG